MFSMNFVFQSTIHFLQTNFCFVLNGIWFKSYLMTIIHVSWFHPHDCSNTYTHTYNCTKNKEYNDVQHLLIVHV